MFTVLTDESFQKSIESIETGVIICFKKLCPHCKNMEKVLEKFSKNSTGISFFKLDSEENPDVMRELNTERIPTIVVIKDGKIAAQKSGLMNPREMGAFYDTANGRE